MDEEKKFLPPTAEIVDYTSDDIITLSGEADPLGWGAETGQDWTNW